MVNRENMEKWISALEAYDREPARGALLDQWGNMCAMGIGIDAMKPGHLKALGSVDDWFDWLGDATKNQFFDVPLKPDGTKFSSVVTANDYGHQSPWTIAQRLRETYLKDES